MAEERLIELRRTRMKATVFLGGGRITSALVAGLRLARYKRTIVVYDRNPEKLRALRRESRVEAARDLKSAVERAEMLIVAVRPASVMQVLEQVAACGTAAPRLCVSLAAGIPLRKLHARLGPPVRWVRAMPSPVCRIGRGLTALSFERGVSPAERGRVRAFFELVGPVMEISEPQFDTFTAVYSSSHGYHALATLATAAQDAGLDRTTALTAAAHALSDGISYWRESRSDLADLLHEAATPGGIAATTMAAMDKSGYARVVRNGVRAGIEQARRNAGR
jgi:pyrroline-5-carboxylate reductase